VLFAPPEKPPLKNPVGVELVVWLPNENPVLLVVGAPKAAGLAVLLKLNEGEAVFVVNEPNDEGVEVAEFPKEKVEGAVLLLAVLFPKLKVLFEVPLLLLLLLLPKLNCEGEFVGAEKLPKAFGVEVFVLIPNPVVGVENEPKDVVPVFPKAEGVEVDVFPKEKADGVPVIGLFPKENGDPVELFVEGVAFPKEVVAFEPNEKDDELVEGVALVWPKADGVPKAVVEVPSFL